jgi:hypothetical protein
VHLAITAAMLGVPCLSYPGLGPILVRRQLGEDRDRQIEVEEVERSLRVAIKQTAERIPGLVPGDENPVMASEAHPMAIAGSVVAVLGHTLAGYRQAHSDRQGGPASLMQVMGFEVVR